MMNALVPGSPRSKRIWNFEMIRLSRGLPGRAFFDIRAGEREVDARSPEGMSEFRALWEHAAEANALLRAMANENRLMILCLLAAGERSVGEIEALTGARQPTVSQQLARLRADGLVESRRDGKVIYYSLLCERTRKVLELLNNMSTGTVGPSATMAGRSSNRRR